MFFTLRVKYIQVQGVHFIILKKNTFLFYIREIKPRNCCLAVIVSHTVFLELVHKSSDREKDLFKAKIRYTFLSEIILTAQDLE